MNRESDENLEAMASTVPATSNASVLSLPSPASFAAGRYQVRRLLGGGGQKRVFLARDTSLDRDVVVALLKTDQLDESSVSRLWREARAMGRLGDHPNIVTVYDIGNEDGRTYIISQYVEGGSVADLLRGAAGTLPIKQVLRIASQICQALIHTHGRGIIHRDLKPANVWLTQDGTVKLGDFGLAVGFNLANITVEGTLVGTVAYMSPEQALGRQAEPGSDLYSLGVILYEMVTGRPPFQGDQLLGIISQHIHTPPVAPSWHNPEIPQSLETLILRLLAKVPEERPKSAAEVGVALETIASSALAMAKRVIQQDVKSLARLAGGIFVGREQEIKVLRDALNDALSGHGRVLMMVGEPGSGKTRTAEQLATYARLREAQVLVGRCYEGDGAPAFWPWVQIIRAFVQQRKPEVLMSVMGPGAADIAQLVSEVKERLPNLASPPSLEAEQARFRLFDSITTFLKNAGQDQPLVLVLDDLHWADKPSLLLLEFLARELRDARLLVVGTYRDMELGRQHPLAQSLGELARLGLSERIVLSGLTEKDVGRFIEMTAGIEPPEVLVAAVRKHTEGNPFFINEVVRLLVAEGRLENPEGVVSLKLRIPQGVREVLGRRLDGLSEQCNHILTIASVVGREFSLDALEPFGTLSGDQLLEVMEEAMASRIISEVPGVLGHYSFSHALIRETLYDELSANRRVRLHRRIAEVLENLYGKLLEPHLAELAYHFFQAAPGGDVEKAINYAVRAAQRATRLLAYEEAVDHYEHALDALEFRDQSDEQQRADLLVALGDAQTKAGSTVRARETFERAAVMARRLGGFERIARAALGIGSGAVGMSYGRVDQAQVDLLKEALIAVGDRDIALRARLLAHLSLALYHLPEQQRVQLSQEAVEIARRVGDTPALLVALHSRCIALQGSERVQERLDAASEIVRIAEQSGDKEMLLRGHLRRFRELLELGAIQSVDEGIESYARLAEELRQPLYLWLTPFCRSTRAMLEGRFEECERLVKTALSIGQRAQDQNAVLFFNTQMVTLRRLQGRAQEVEASVKDFVEKYPSIPAWRATLAVIYSEMDCQAEAQREFERLACNEFVDLPRDGAWVTGLAVLAQTCAFLHDSPRANKLYEMLLPFAGRNIVIGSAAAFYGPVARHLGLLAATMSRWDQAARHFEDALTMNKKMGARPFEVYGQQEYGAMLLARGRPGDQEKAFRLIEQAFVTASELGMNKVVEDLQPLICKAERASI